MCIMAVMDKMIDGGGMRGRRVGGGALRARRRGFIHILLLVFTVLGVSLWGITEMLHRSQEASRESELKHSERMSRALEALLDYAVLAPERIQAEERAGRYNVYAGRDNVLRHRYFTMPCPDSNRDGNWDGASDWESAGGCDDVTATDVRIGRFPWRTESAADGGQLSYIRGMGEDLVDRHGDRFWYAAAYNMLRRDRAVNPHWLLRQTHGWIALAENDTPADAAETSYVKRVAGVVVSPGIAGSGSNVNDSPELLQRIPEVGAVSVTVLASVALGNIAAYLEINLPAAADSADCNFGFGWNYSDVCSTQEDNIPPFQRRTPTGERINNLIYYNSPPESRSDDRLAYITVEELAADGGKGVEAMLGQPGNVLDIISGGRGFLGVRRVMNSYFNRHGALPAPAAFNKAAGENLVRLRGAPGGGGGSAGAWIRSAAGVTVTAVLPVRNIRRVYLQPGAVLLAEDANFNRDGFPPYNLALYGMETSFNTEPMPGDVRTALMAADIYPRENLLGYRNTVTAFATESTRVRSISPPPDGGALPPLDARVYLKKAPPVRGVSFSPEQRITGLEIPMALAEPALAHIVGGALSSVVAGHLGGVVSESPNYGLQVELPEGTRFMLSGDELNPVSLFLRSGVQSPPAEYNIAERRWELTRQWPEPVLLEYPSDGVVTITAVVENSNVRSANIGFLPVDDTAVDYYSPHSRYRFEGDRMLRGRVTLRAGSRFGGLRRDAVHRTAGVNEVLRPRFPVSVLPEDLVLYTESRLVVSPFPPPGRPVLATTAVSSPHPLYINYAGGVAGRVSPGEAFTLPEGTRIFYPTGATVNLGVDFQFPAGTRALLPDGAVMTLQALSGSTLPDGRRADLQTVRVSEGAALGDAVDVLQSRAVTLVHGGVMDLYGPSGTAGPDGVRVEGAAVVLRDGTGVGSSQELFNIEHGIGGVVGTPQSTVNFYGAVLQPLAAREIRGGVESLGVRFDQPFRLSTWTRMQFLTRPQNVVDFAGAYRITTTLDVDAVAGRPDASSIEIQATVAGPLLVRNYQWQGSRAVTVELMALAGAAAGTARITAALTLSEQTRFMLPPGEYNRFDMTIGGGLLFSGGPGPGRIIRLDGGFIFPVSTAFYDPHIRSLEDFSVGGVNGWPALAAPLTVSLTDGITTGRGAIQSQLVMFLDSGLHAVSVTRNDSGTEEVAPIPPNSVWSMLSNNAFPPGSFAEWMRADGEVGAVSGGEIMMYFPEGVLLTNRGVYEVIGRHQNSPATLEVNYSPPCNCTVTLAYANAGAGEFTGVAGTSTLSLVGVTADFNEGAITTDIGVLDLPHGSFIVLPAGSTLDFLTESKSFDGNADFTVLPEIFTAVLPGGSTVNLGSHGLLTVSENGLGYLRFDGGPAGPATITTNFGEREQGVFRMALVANEIFMPDTPLIYYSEDAYLTGLHGLRDNVGVRIPAGSRGDLFGMIYGRHSPDLEVNALPSDTAGALRNFPLVYAVAPNCREDVGGGGEDCADGERGLEFAVETGERVELEHELIPHGNLYITLHSEAAESLPFVVTHRNNADFYNDMAATASLTVNALGVNGNNGEVHRFRPDSDMRDFRDDIHEAVVPAGAPADAVFRVYMGLPDDAYTLLVNNAVRPSRADLENLHYAEMRAITLFAGGWSRDSDVADAKVKVALDAPEGSGRLRLGYGANIGGNLEDEFIFGRGGYYDVMGGGGTYRLPLDGYKLAGPLFGFELGFNSESTHADVDFAGNVLSKIGPDERVVVKEEQSLALNDGGGAGFAAAEIITLHEDAEIDMAPGYLWQGYLDVKSRGEPAPRLSLSFNRQASLETGDDGFRNQVFVRVHPQDDRLNFWGSGRETPMGLDGRSPDHRSHSVRDNNGNLRWGKIQPVDALDFEFHVHDNRITLAEYITTVGADRIDRDDHIDAAFLRKVGPVSPYFLDDRYPLGGGFPPGSSTRERDFGGAFFNRIGEHNLDFWHRTPGGSINRIPVSYVMTAGRAVSRINRINITGIQSSLNADGAAYDGISPDIGDVLPGSENIEGIGRGAHGNGYRSRILDGGNDGMRMSVRVRDARGMSIADGELRWNPVYRPLLPSAGPASNGFYTITVAGTSDVRTRRGWVAWGANNSPFDIPDQSYVNPDEVWAVRIHAAYNHDGSMVTVSDGDRINLTGTIAGGGRVNGIFDMPPFQLRSTRLGRPSASHYADSANIITDNTRVRPCGGAPSSENNINSARVPALLLGHWADAERHDSGSGAGCGTNIGQRLPSFSTRPRRGAGLDPWETVPISVAVSVNQIRADLFGGGGQMVIAAAGGTVQNIYPVIDVPQNEQRITIRLSSGTLAVQLEDYRNFGGTPGNDILTTFRQRAATWSRSTLSISYSEFIDSGRGAPFRRTRSNNLAETDVLIFDDGFEVRGAQNGDPNDFNRAVPVNASLSYNSENPLNYVVPVFNDGPADLYARDRDGQRFSENNSTLFRSSGATMTVHITAPVEAPVFGDMAFYMDRAYRTRGFGGIDAQTLHIGDDFRIAGPGALVPHFGGHNMGAVADVYAARSAFLHGLFGEDDNFKLHRVYSANTGGEHCPSSLRSSPPQEICPAMYDPDNARYWIPIISGIAAFEAVSIGFAGDPDADFDVFTVLPQPEAEVLAEDGSTLTIYGGSVIRPRERTVRRALRIPANSTLVLFGDAAAAVDVSPVYAPTPINLIREDAIMRERDFNFNPIRSGNLIIEPLGFIPPEEDHIINFGRALLGTGSRPPTACMANSYENREQGGRVFHNWEYGEWCRALEYRRDESTSPRNTHVIYGYNPISPLTRVGNNRSQGSTHRINTRWPTDGVDFMANYTPGLGYLSNIDQENPRFFALTTQGPRALDGGRPAARPPDNIRTHHDGTTARGFLMNDDMADLMTDYFRGDPIFVRSNKFITYFPRRGYNALSGQDSGTIEMRYSDSLPPANNQVAPPGNPLSWHWLQGHDGDPNTYNGTFIPMGAARQFHFPQDRANPDVPIYVLTEECHGRYPQYPTPPPPPPSSGSYYTGAPLDAGTFDAVPCAGEDSHYWVGVYYNPEFEESDGGAGLRDEFTALRLPHSIRIPATTEIALTPYRNTPLYPITTSQFFEFPAGSTARILQVDAASWESVHPYAARYMPGAVFANDGGLNPGALSTSDNLRDITEETRRLLRAAEEMRVSENNDGIREIDVGGLKVLHFAKTESSHRYRSSNVDVHTNVWIKLLHGGYLKNENGEAVVNLPPNTVINPVLGTYLPGEPSAPVERTLKSNYQAAADVEPERRAEIARPAMIIPPGTTIRIGAAGANITEVKAAAIFSVAPLDNINCAAGGVSGGEFLQNGLPDSAAVSQSREGVSENAYSGEFTVGHPCAWLDDRENTDGDRFFVYRSRRRYLEPYKSRVLSNDRTYLFGGTLRLS